MNNGLKGLKGLKGLNALKEKRKNLTIAQAAKEFGWSYSNIKPFIDLVNDSGARLRGKTWSELKELSQTARFREIKRWYFEYAAIITINDVLKQLEIEYKNHGPRGANGYRACINHLVSIGFTNLDSIALPLATVPFAELKQMSREQLLKLDAVSLGSLSHKLLSQLGTSDDRATIADILEMEHCSEYYKGAIKTFLLLKELGFGPKDGKFMREDPIERFVQKLLASDDGLTLGEARKFAVIAAKRNWIWKR